MERGPSYTNSMPGFRRAVRIEDGVVKEDSVQELSDAELRQAEAVGSSISHQVQETIAGMKAEMDERMAAMRQELDRTAKELRAGVVPPIPPIKPIEPIKPLKPLF